MPSFWMTLVPPKFRSALTFLRLRCFLAQEERDTISSCDPGSAVSVSNAGGDAETWIAATSASMLYPKHRIDGRESLEWTWTSETSPRMTW